MVLDCPCLAFEAQLIQNLLNKPHTQFGMTLQLDEKWSNPLWTGAPAAWPPSPLWLSELLCRRAARSPGDSRPCGAKFRAVPLNHGTAKRK